MSGGTSWSITGLVSFSAAFASAKGFDADTHAELRETLRGTSSATNNASLQILRLVKMQIIQGTWTITLKMF